jgi:hypothetical protein
MLVTHVGIRKLTRFFRQCYDMLNDDGAMYVQLSGLRQAWQYEDFIWGLFLNKYIFRGADASTPLWYYVKHTQILTSTAIEINQILQALHPTRMIPNHLALPLILTLSHPHPLPFQSTPTTNQRFHTRPIPQINLQHWRKFPHHTITKQKRPSRSRINSRHGMNRNKRLFRLCDDNFDIRI